jgi:hypothetical protein
MNMGSESGKHSAQSNQHVIVKQSQSIFYTSLECTECMGYKFDLDLDRVHIAPPPQRVKCYNHPRSRPISCCSALQQMRSSAIGLISGGARRRLMVEEKKTKSMYFSDSQENLCRRKSERGEN